MTLKIIPTIVLGCLVLVGITATTNFGFAEETEEQYKYYRVDAKVISLDANQSLASYRPHGGGSGSPGSTLGYSTPVGKITIVPTVESDRFYADVTIRAKNASDAEVGEKQRLELTSLRPTYLALGTDESGRDYQLNLTPSVVAVQLEPLSFQKAAEDLYRLKFHSSRIVLNDKQYIGQMLASNAEVFSIEVCDIASIEFSLHHLKDAEPWGRLQNGQITLIHPDDTSIVIGNVTNGESDQLIDGGPFVVWVRWGKPQQTAEEYRAVMSSYRDQVSSDPTIATAGTLAILDRELAREPGPWVISSGARAVRKREIVADE